MALFVQRTGWPHRREVDQKVADPIAFAQVDLAVDGRVKQQGSRGRVAHNWTRSYDGWKPSSASLSRLIPLSPVRAWSGGSGPRGADAHDRAKEGARSGQDDDRHTGGRGAAGDPSCTPPGTDRPRSMKVTRESQSLVACWKARASAALPSDSPSASPQSHGQKVRAVASRSSRTASACAQR